MTTSTNIIMEKIHTLDNEILNKLDNRINYRLVLLNELVTEYKKAIDAKTRQSFKSEIIELKNSLKFTYAKLDQISLKLFLKL